MKPFLYVAVSLVTFGVFLHAAHATDRFFRDITVESPSKRYKVEAKSPDNLPSGWHRFQASFVYTCRDSTAGKLLWTRKQAMEKPVPLGDNSALMYRSPKEASPVDIFVSNTGWTVIRTGWDELIAVDSAGHDRTRIKLLSEAFTEEDDKYVHQTTAGPMWSGYSLWYFLDVDGQALFIVRPWWGRRVMVNLETGKLVQASAAVFAGALAYERNYVLAELSKGVDNRPQWDNEEAGESVWPILNASYLAGRIQVKEAIPFLEKLQDSPLSGSSTSGGLGWLERFDGEVNPHSYGTFTLRQVIHLSLRRLGKVPKPLPLNQFDLQYEDRKKNRPYVPKPLSVAREANADKVKKGMKAEQVLDLLGAPDFVGYKTWEYDMDSSAPFSLIVNWDVRHVLDIQKKMPALWKEDFARDEQIIR